MKLRFSYITELIKNKFVLSLISNGTNAIIGMLTLSILLRALSLGEMGDWGFFLTILLFFDTFRSGFLATSFVKFYAGSTDERKNAIAGSAWFIALSITLIFVLINIPLYFLSYSTEDEGLKLFLRFFSLNYVVSLPFFMANCVLQAKQRFDSLLFLNFSNQGSFLIFVLIAIFLKHINIDIVLYCYLGSNILSSAFSLICGWTEINKLKFYSKKTNQELYHFGKFSVGTNITSSFLSVITTFVIKFFLGAAPLAIFNAGTKLIQIVELPLRSIVYAAMPTLSAHFNQGNKAEVLNLTKKYAGMLTLLLAPVCLFIAVFSDFAILILGGRKYVATEAPHILSIFMIVTLLFPAERFFALMLDVIHRPKINFIKVVIVIAVSSIVGTLAVYLMHSIYGMVLAGVICTLAGLLIGYYALNKYYIRFGFWDVFTTGYNEVVLLIKNTYKIWFPKSKGSL